MRGFMCQSVEVTSGCTIPDARDVILPKRILCKNEGALKGLGDRKALIANCSMESVPRTAPPSGNMFQASDWQVVVMRVSLHCQGCAGKVKKHLSRMEGVTSFSIDLEEKRVTVRGHVSPAVVLESISKVKRAEFWTGLPFDG